MAVGKGDEEGEDYGFWPRVFCGCVYAAILSYVFPALITWQFDPGDWSHGFRLMAMAGAFVSFRVSFSASKGGE